MDAWLIFPTSDEPEQILALIEAFPEFRSMYQDIYELCRNIEGVMGMFSKELQELDRNTIEFMIDEMQNEINRKDAQLNEMNVQLNEKDAQLNEKDSQLIELKRALVDEAYRKKLLKNMNT